MLARYVTLNRNFEFSADELKYMTIKNRRQHEDMHTRIEYIY